MTSAMKLLEIFTQGLFNLKQEPLKNNQNVDDAETKSGIRRSFSKEEDDFLFIWMCVTGWQINLLEARS